MGLSFLGSSYCIFATKIDPQAVLLYTISVFLNKHIFNILRLQCRVVVGIAALRCYGSDFDSLQLFF